MKKVGNKHGRFYCNYALCKNNDPNDLYCLAVGAYEEVQELSMNPKDCICPAFLQKENKTLEKFEKLWRVKDDVLPSYKKEFVRLLTYTARKLYNKEVFDPRVVEIVENSVKF